MQALPPIFTLRLIDRRWWIEAPTDDPLRREPVCLAAGRRDAVRGDVSPAAISEKVKSVVFYSPLFLFLSPLIKIR
jgi:hypothetical protein